VKASDQGRTDRDQRGAHDQRAQNAPKEHLVLVEARDLEIRKDDEENEKIVNA
jgi:hypothetical protein